jgi:hypothetical protein
VADFQAKLELTSELEEGRLSSVESDIVELQRWIVREVESSVNVLPRHMLQELKISVTSVRITDPRSELESGNLIIDTSIRIQTF